MRLLGLLGAVAAVLVALVLLLPAVRRLDNRAAVGSARSGVDRSFPAASRYGIPAAALARLATVIPRGDRYAIVLPGHGADVPSLAFPGLVSDFLLPRRQVQDRTARWVVAYGVSPARFGLPVRPAAELPGGVRVAEVAR